MAERGIFAIMDLEWTSWEGASQRRWSGPGIKAVYSMGTDFRVIERNFAILTASNFPSTRRYSSMRGYC